MFYVMENSPIISDSKDIFTALINILISAEFLDNLLETFKVIIYGIGLAIIFGVTTGIFMALSENFHDIIEWVFNFLRNIPGISLFPILLVIFGISRMSRITVIFWTSYPSILINTFHGLTSVDETLIESAEDLGATKLKTMFLIRLPLAIPDILTGIKIGISGGIVGVVTAEMLGANKGIGYMITWMTNAFKYPNTYAYIIILGLIGMFIDSSLNFIITKLKRRIEP